MRPRRADVPGLFDVLLFINLSDPCLFISCLDARLFCHFPEVLVLSVTEMFGKRFIPRTQYASPVFNLTIHGSIRLLFLPISPVALSPA